MWLLIFFNLKSLINNKLRSSLVLTRQSYVICRALESFYNRSAKKKIDLIKGIVIQLKMKLNCKD